MSRCATGLSYDLSPTLRSYKRKGVERNNESSRESLTTVPTCLNLIKYNVIGCIEGVMNQSKSSSTMFNKTAMKSTKIKLKTARLNLIDEPALEFNLMHSM